MEQRMLGTTGLSVSVLGLGTVKIGRNQGVKYPGGPGFPLPTDAEVEALLDRALELGVTLLDTAPAYGTSEERLGKLLGARRDRFVLVSKAGEEFADGVSTWDFSPEHIEESVARSLRRLRTDRIECVLLHCDRDDLKALAALDTLAKLKQKGDILSFGASTYTVAAGVKTVERADVVMVEYHAETAEPLPVIVRAAAQGKGVLVKKGLRSGHLAGEEALASNLRHILGTPGVTSLIVGTINPAHLAANVKLAATP